jgi:protein-S-isoprenylcysteine O-methyltransferase Ste14
VDPTLSHVPTKVAFLVTLGAWGVGERFLGCRDLWRGARRKGSQDRGTVWWTAGSVLVAVVTAFALSTVRRLDLPGTLIWVIVGLSAAWCGIGVRAWAVRTLGRYFTTIVIVREDQQLVSTGPYRWLIHPSYTGLLLILAGLGCALDNLGSLLAMLLIPIIGLSKRIAVEESALHDRFGDAYVTFAGERSRLIPHVW